MSSKAETSLSYQWISSKRNYDDEKKSVPECSTVPPNQHPLKPFVETVTQSNQENNKRKSTTPTNFIDPLSGDMTLDPLSKMVADISFKEKQETLKLNEAKSSFEPWSLKKSSILSKYTTVEKLSITSSFLTPIAGAVKDKAMATKNLTTVSDKIKERLEKLDQFDDDNMQEMANLSQQEYIKRIDELNNALLTAWNEDDRVKSLKIVIQCSKLLADTSVIQFYPSKFVLITDILDTFGRLVYERIKTKSSYFTPGSTKPQPLPENFSCDIVPNLAKETCRNWFFKIASIRELLPRIYVEASILKCTNFLSDETIARPINRLISMTSGIGDPLVSAFTNCYICRVGISIDPKIREYQLVSLENLLFAFRQITKDRIKKLLVNQKINSKIYLELYCPAMDWILQCVCTNRPQEYLKEVLEKCNKVSNQNRIVSGLLINSMMSSFDPSFVSSIANQIIEMIKDCDDEYFPKHLLFRNLGMYLVFNESSSSEGASKKEDKEKLKQELQLLNDVWKIVTKFDDANSYIGCAEIWIEYTLKNFTKKEVNTLLGDIIRHVQPDRIFENFYPQLQSIVTKILVYIVDFNILFSMDKFMQFLNLFQKESVKLDVFKSVTYAFLKSDKEYDDDIVVINSMMQICKSLHDYVNALTLDDEKREISKMICSFINRLKLNDKSKIEQYLNFFSEARASFSNLDDVISLLVHKVNTIAMETLKFVNYNHTTKTASFVRACIAYSFISIPSLNNPILKLKLYLESAQVALLNQCLSQADAFLKSAISLIPDLQKQTEMHNSASISTMNFDTSNISKASGSLLTMGTVEKFLGDYLSNVMSTLLIIPDNPDQGVLYLLTGVLNIILKHFTWENNEIKLNLLFNMLNILGALKQEKYLFNIENVELNDTLYGSDIKYLKEVNNSIEQVMGEILNLISNSNAQKQPFLAAELLNRLISHADLKNEATLNLAEYLWRLSKNQQTIKFQEQIIATIKFRAKNHPEYSLILTKLGIN